MEVNVLEYRKRILAKVLARLPLVGQETAVDVGCGEGDDCFLLLQNVKETIGLDIRFSSNWSKIENPRIAFSVADVCTMPFPDDSFELVFEKDVLHHVEDPLKASREILRITKPKGHMVCIEGNRYNPIFYFHMTLMKGHEHFSKIFFTELMKTYSQGANIFSVESRVYPVKSINVLHFLHYFENFMEKIPFIRNFLC